MGAFTTRLRRIVKDRTDRLINPVKAELLLASAFATRTVFALKKQLIYSLKVRTKNRFFIAGCSVILYLLSLTLPALKMYYAHSLSDTGTHAVYIYGGTLLTLGIFGMADGVYAWLANLLYIITLIYFLFGAYRGTVVAGFFTTVCMLSSFQLYFLHVIYPLDEGGVMAAKFASLSIGAYVWFASLLLPFCFAMYYLNKKIN